MVALAIGNRHLKSKITITTTQKLRRYVGDKSKYTKKVKPQNSKLTNLRPLLNLPLRALREILIYQELYEWISQQILFRLYGTFFAEPPLFS